MKHKRFTLSLIGIVGLAAMTTMLIFFSPTDIGPIGVLVFLTTLYVVVFCFFSLAMQAFRRVALKKNECRIKDYLGSAVLAFGPIMLLMARSFGAINVWTISLIVLFLTLTEFLVYKKI